MPHRVCPKCQHDGRLLEATSQSARVDYYRCDECGHVWSHLKGQPDSPATDVTIEPKKAS